VREALATTEKDIGLAWEHRFALWLPRPLYVGTFLLAVFLGATYLSFQWFFDFLTEPSAFGIEVFLVAVLIAPAYFFDRQDRQHGDKEHQSFANRGAVYTSRFAGVAGVLAAICLWELIQVAQGREFLSTWTVLYDGSSITAMFLLLGWLFGRSGYFLSTGIWDKPAPEREHIDILNLESIYVIGRSGLAGALAWFIMIAIAGVLIVPTVDSGLWLVISLFAINLGGGLMILLAPARKIRSLIVEVKQEELMRLEPLLGQARDDALADKVSSQGRLGDLLAYKTRIESTQEWPFDSSTLFRFGLYLFIPVALMIGGALVERIVDFMLD
jgi:hypothetical protein